MTTFDKTFEITLPKTTEQEMATKALGIKLSNELATIMLPISIADNTLYKGVGVDPSTGTAIEIFYPMRAIVKNIYDFFQIFTEDGIKVITPNLTVTPNGEKLELNCVEHQTVITNNVKELTTIPLTNFSVNVALKTARIDGHSEYNFTYEKGADLPQTVIDKALSVYNIELSQDVDKNIIIKSPYEYKISLSQTDTLLEDLNGFNKGAIKVLR